VFVLELIAILSSRTPLKSWPVCVSLVGIVEKICPDCGSDQVKPKGYVSSKTFGTVRGLICAKCGRRFRAKYCKKWKASNIPKNILELYPSVSLNKLIISNTVSASRSTLYWEIRRRLDALPDWRKLLHDERARRMWGGILGVDTTKIKVGGREYIYLHAADIPSGNPLACEVLEDEKADSIARILCEIRTAGYWPKLVVTDLAAETVKALEMVFPGVPVQACIFHLIKWLNENLPTVRKGLSPDDRVKRYRIKEKILLAALAFDDEERQALMNELRALSGADDEEKRVVEQFERRLKTGRYLTLEELTALKCELRYVYNNVCERFMESVKDLQRRMRGFKTVETAQKYINLLCWSKLKEKLKDPVSIEPYWDSKSMAEQILSLIPRGLRDIVNLKRIAELTRLPLNNLQVMAERLGLIAVGGYAFSKGYLRRLLQKLLDRKPTTVMEATTVTGIDAVTLSELLPKIGLVLANNKITKISDLWEEARIVYPSDARA